MSHEPNTPDDVQSSTPADGVSADSPSAGARAPDGIDSATAGEPQPVIQPHSSDDAGDRAPADATAATDPSAPAAAAPAIAAAHTLDLPEFESADLSDSPHGLDLLDDVELNVKIELGRTEMYVEDVLRLGVGSVVELDKLAGDPVDIYVNERLIGRGEVLVLNDSFCVRVNEILSPVPERES